MKKRNSASLIGGSFVVLFLAGLGLALFQFSRTTPTQKTIMLVTGDYQAEAAIKGVDKFYKQHPELAKQVEVIIRTKSNINERDSVPPSDIMVVKVLEIPLVEQHLSYIKRANESFAGRGLPGVRLMTGVPGLKYTDADYESFGMKRDPAVEAYLENGAPADYARLFAYLLNRYAGYNQLAIEKPSPTIDNGLGVYKNGDIVKLVSTWAEWEAAQKPDPKKDKIAVLVSGAIARAGILNIEKAIMKRLAEAGVEPVFVFGYPSSKAIKQTILDMLTGKSRVKACISQLYKFPDKTAAATLTALNVPLVNAIDIYGPTIDEWKMTRKGLSSAEIAWQIAIPELAGMVQPTVVGGVKMDGNIPEKMPIPERVDRIVNRALRYVKLQNTSPTNRKIALLYWNYPPGKDNIGASYLNVIKSIPMVLDHLRKEGYAVTGFDNPASRNIEKLIMSRGRNIGNYAPGELEKIVAAGAQTVPVSTYKKWFAGLDEEYQAQIVNHWGAPEKATIMTIQKAGELHFVIPLIRFGNVSIMPQADRARTQDLAALYHSQTLPPHHQYLCQYLWLQRNMDALIHTGTHGTQEWLDGKETGLSERDSPEVMAGDLPILYIYNMDVVGEGIQSKRRGAATMVDHLTPALGEAGLTPELKKLNALIRQWETIRSLDPEGTKPILASIDEMAGKMGIKKDLEKNGWGAKTTLNDQKEDRIREMVEELQHYIEETREHSTPFGLHTFGVAPTGKRLDEFAAIIAKTNGVGKQDFFRTALVKTGPEELRMLTHGLNGRYVTPESGNDPIRSPSSIPTGRNFFTFDPRTVPVPYADSIGRRMAARFVADFKKNNGKFPEKVTFEIWSTETIRHQGFQEAQAFGLLGVRLKRDKTGKVEDLELIPRKELGRPRVDVNISTTGLYRDTFPMFIDLLDKAVRLAATSPEADNNVRNHGEKVRQLLVKKGMDTTEARIRSLVRVFAEPSGTYSSKMSETTYASGSWDDEKQVAELYIRRMGNGYGGGIWGESMETEYKEALKGTQAIIHSRSSSLYMSLDNDDFFGFAGAIALGVRYAENSKKSPPILVADLRVKGNEGYMSIERFMGEELRSRYFNPEYIKAMTKEGYAGARHVMQGVEWMWGWQVVYPEVVNAEKWQEFYEVWMKDRYDLKTDEFFEENSPHAKESMASFMLEATRKGYWTPTEAVKQDLAKIYVETVAKNGVSCGHMTCDHPQLHNFIKGVALANNNVKASDVTKWVKNVETATGKTIGSALAQRIADKKQWQDPTKVKQYKPNEPAPQMARASNPKQTVKGYKMVEEKVIDNSKATAGAGKPTNSPVNLLYLLAIGAQVLCVVVGGIRRWR